MNDAGLTQKPGNAVELKLRVTPRASRTEFSGMTGNTPRLKVKAPPVEGAANEECVRYLASILGVAKGRIRLAKGEKSREKVFRLEGISLEQARDSLGPLMKS